MRGGLAFYTGIPRGSEHGFPKFGGQSSILFCLLLLQNSTPFPKLTVIYESWGSRTSYLRSRIHPGRGCFMVVRRTTTILCEGGSLYLFIPENQFRILQDLIPLLVETFQSQCLRVCKSYFVPTAVESDNFY